jgi:hypothetical protein
MGGGGRKCGEVVGNLISPSLEVVMLPGHGWAEAERGPCVAYGTPRRGWRRELEGRERRAVVRSLR